MQGRLVTTRHVVLLQPERVGLHHRRIKSLSSEKLEMQEEVAEEKVEVVIPELLRVRC